MLSRNLEMSSAPGPGLAPTSAHEYATLEHLLLALVEDQDAVAVLRACSVDLDRLRDQLTAFVDNELGQPGGGPAGRRPQADRRLPARAQRAAIHVPARGANR